MLVCVLVGIAGSQLQAQKPGKTDPGRTKRSYPAPTPGDFVIRDFRFQSGEVLPELKLHYRTLGTPIRQGGVTRNAVLVLHGTGGSGQNFLTEQFAGGLFWPGKLLDASPYHIIFPARLAHRQTNKTNDGLPPPCPP